MLDPKTLSSSIGLVKEEKENSFKGEWCQDLKQKLQLKRPQLECQGDLNN